MQIGTHDGFILNISLRKSILLGSFVCIKYAIFLYFPFFSDMVRDILETRAEIYRALHQTPRSESDEEEGPTIEDIQLEEHLKLKESILEG